jgi:ATP-dependent Lhr-like helicase
MGNSHSDMCGPSQMAAAGRWSLTGMPRTSAALPGAESGTGRGVEIEGGADLAARVLLDRYGVVFRRVCTWELWLPPWHDLVAVYRRREARGELRGGALPRPGLGGAVRPPRSGQTPSRGAPPRGVPGAGLAMRCRSAQPGRHRPPGGAVPRGSGRVLYLDGVPIASQSRREVHMSEDLDRGEQTRGLESLRSRSRLLTRSKTPFS